MLLGAFLSVVGAFLVCSGAARFIARSIFLGEQMSKAAAGVIGFDEALTMVLAHAADLAAPATEQISLLTSEERVLANAVLADRDQPPFDRSTRDGFAVRAADFGNGPLKIAGQIRAGEQWGGSALQPGVAIG